MGDWSELKRLAEAFPSDLDWDSNEEPFFNGPSGESLGGGSTGFYSVYGKPFRIEGEDYDYDGPTYIEACTVDFAKFMIAARDGVLALIAENEKLKVDLQDVKDARLGLNWALGEIKAENEALRKDSERFRWTNIEGNWVARMFGKWRAHVGEYGDASPTEWYPSREEAIDAAIRNSKG